MKFGDIVNAKRPTPPVKSDGPLGCRFSNCLEVIEDLGETVVVRCVVASGRKIYAKYTVRKDHYRVFKTLEERLEENNMNPVIGTASGTGREL